MKLRDPIHQAPRLLWLAALVLALVLQTACRSARRGEPLVGTLPQSDPNIARGRVYFAHHCSACHPGGEGGLGPSLNDKALPRYLIKTQVRLGMGVMPEFDRAALTPGQLDDLVDYLVALRQHDKPRRR